ncbi:hypothetical protein [Plantactinospora veratri]
MIELAVDDQVVEGDVGDRAVLAVADQDRRVGVRAVMAQILATYT